MKPGHVNAFAWHFLEGLPSSFKHTIVVCEKVAPGEVLIKVSPDDHKQVQALIDEGDSVDSVSRKAKMTEFLKGATAVGVVSANGELLINTGAFLKSLVDHGCSQIMETAMNKMKFEVCCHFKHGDADKLKAIEVKTGEIGVQLEKLGQKKRRNPPGKSGDSDGSGSDEDSTENGMEEKSWWSQVGKAVGSLLGW